MCRAIAHRGPDDSGTFVDAEAGVALGHRRLSIIDLSPLGHQPMTSADGRYVIT
jgi:asparagine synthase (glutamine-hydrolysing)